jgi:integrase
LVFPGRDIRRPLSDMTLLKILRYAELPYTVHGFRSAFRDWAAEQTSYPGEVAEAALAHSIANRVEAAYRRTNYLDKRRVLMADWGAFCTAAEREEDKLQAPDGSEAGTFLPVAGCAAPTAR